MGLVKEMMIEMEERGDLPIGLEDKYVCASHFDDRYLQKKIHSIAQKGVCSYCGKKKQVVNMQDFGEFISRRIHDSYEDVHDAALLSAKDFYDDDDEVIPGFKTFCGYVVPEEAECYDSTPELLNMLELDVDNEGLREDIEGIFTTQKWVSRDILSTERMEIRMNELWDTFSSMVKCQRRFTFLADPSFLESLKKSKDKYLTEDKNILDVLSALINQTNLITSLDAKANFFRVRKVNKIEPKYGFDDITSPPDSSAFQNRMSPAGISMFYASFDEETARLEAVGEDPVGILIGRFRPKHRLHVVDLTAIPQRLSFWMDNFQENIFLKRFNKEVTKPVAQDDKDIEYIPTQVLTEYLRYMFKDYKRRTIDGIIYGSSQEAKNKNLVLFCNQKASRKYIELAAPIKVYTKEWIKVRDDM